MTRAVKHFRAAFSLVELLVCIGIIGLLIGLTMPAVQQVRERAGNLACRNKLKQIGLAAHHYESVAGILPPCALLNYKNGRQFGAMQWTHLLLPYLEHESLYRDCWTACHQDPAFYHKPPHWHIDTVVSAYTCPADGRLSAPITDAEGYTGAYASYFGNGGTMGGLNGPFGMKLTSFTDGTSQTILIGERPPPGVRHSGSWYAFGYTFEWGYDTYSRHLYGFVDYPMHSDPCAHPIFFGPGNIDNPCDSHHFWSLHPGGANFVFVDGSVHFLRYSASALIPALATRNGGEVVGSLD